MRHSFVALAALAVFGTNAPAAETPACTRLATRIAAAEGVGGLKLVRLTRRYADKCVRLNQTQVLGSHNSYHIQPRPALFDALVAFLPELIAFEYTHLPLHEQFETQKIRQIELDIFHDPAGGKYANRPILALLGDDTAGPPELSTPGFKTFHVQDIDFETTCTTFVECLQVVKAWSDNHPHHLPIMILVEAKDEAIPDPLNLGFQIPLPIGAAELDQVDAEIRSVFPARRLLTPDDIRGQAATLASAVQTSGWPTLRKARGKVMFALDNGGGYRSAYLAGHPNLEGRVMFADSAPGDDHAAFAKRNDPIGDGAEIADLVAQGFVVRTRADSDTQHARTGDTTMRDAAIASGAQWVSTDYPVPNPDFGTGYMVEIPGGVPARCNPINGPAGCRAASLERLP